MSELAVVGQGGQLVTADEATAKVRASIQKAREHRKQFEPTWHSNLAFAAGKFWHEWHPQLQRLVIPEDIEGRELYSADVITEYRTAALGELSSDDDRPELLLARDDEPSQGYAKMLNRAIEWGWEHEWLGDSVLSEVNRLVIDLGTAAIRCRFDPTVGPVMQENVPHRDGKPLLDPEEARAALAEGPDAGIEMKPVREGRIVWEPLTPFNLIVPPGIPNEREFPWECVVRPVLLDTVREEYGDLAEDLTEDGDIGSLIGLDAGTAQDNTTGAQLEGAQRGKLEGHVWLFTYYERPCPKYPEGRKIVFASNAMKVVEITDRLPYVDPNGAYCSGITYFHWWRATGRFWSRSLVEGMKDVQRAVNKRRTQVNEIIDRGLPFVLVQKNSPAKERRGLAVELVEIGQNEREPKIVEGVRPGDWMWRDIDSAREDLEHATGIKGPRLGENPTNVTTYAQLALINENDQVKRATIQKERKDGIRKLVKLSVYDIRTYWGPQKTMYLASDEETVEKHVFDATKIPPYYIVRTPKGASKPRSQAAEIKKIEDIWAGALASGAVMNDPHSWVEWLKQSLEAGQALDLPEGGSDAHQDKAELENAALKAGEPVYVQYYDRHELHIPIHREAQFQAELTGDLELWARIELHVQEHVLKAQETAQTMAQVASANAEAMPLEEGPPEEGGAPPAGGEPA